MSPDQVRAVDQADVVVEAVNMPSYTTLLLFAEEIRDIIRDSDGLVLSTFRQRCRKALDATDFEPVQKPVE